LLKGGWVLITSTAFATSSLNIRCLLASRWNDQSELYSHGSYTKTDVV